MQIDSDRDIVIETTGGRYLLFNTDIVLPKAMKDTIGVSCFTLKRNNKIAVMREHKDGEFVKDNRYRAKSLPSTGALLSTEDAALKNNFTLEGFDG